LNLGAEGATLDRMRRCGLGGWILVLSACRPDATDTVDPDLASAPVVAAPASTSESSEAPEDETPAEIDAPDEPAPEDVPTTEPDDDGALTVADAAELVAVAIDTVTDPYAGRVITPPLPASWPLDGRVAYYVYPLAAVEGASVDTYQAKLPSHRAVLDLATREVTLEPLPASKKLGSYQRSRVRHDDDLAKAEQALLDVAAGRAELDAMHYRLAAYGPWFEQQGKIGSDCRKRVKAFADWAASWGH
jgi:hypothetical protein